MTWPFCESVYRIAQLNLRQDLKHLFLALAQAWILQFLVTLNLKNYDTVRDGRWAVDG
jgi:hypothetical protein